MADPTLALALRLMVERSRQSKVPRERTICLLLARRFGGQPYDYFKRVRAAIRADES